MSLLQQRLRPILETFVEKGPAGCSLMVARGGETLYEDYVGVMDLETKKPIGPDTIYRIYSMSKVITCAAALMLYERGPFALNDPLSEYLPEFKDMQVYRHNPQGALYTDKAACPIRVKDLFCMTSGIPYPGEGTETARHMARVYGDVTKGGSDKPWTVREMTKVLSGIPLAFDPGSHWMYGMSHDVLGAFIEALSGKAFGQFLKENIFDPLGMKDTAFRIGEGKRSRLCGMYSLEADGSRRKITDMDSDYQPGASFEGGGGGLLSTLSDYTRFAQALALGELNGVRILSDHTIDLMATNHLDAAQMADFNWEQMAGYGYGLGVRVLIDRAAGGCSAPLGEFGWAGLAGTLVFIDRAEQLTITYMQQMMPNQEGYHMPRIRNAVYGAI